MKTFNYDKTKLNQDSHHKYVNARLIAKENNVDLRSFLRAGWTRKIISEWDWYNQGIEAFKLVRASEDNAAQLMMHPKLVREFAKWIDCPEFSYWVRRNLKEIPSKEVYKSKIFQFNSGC
jgi:hypothetical protein